jgi:ribosomal protein S27AE
MSFLTECFVCGKPVSREAAVCPHCGDPNFIARNETEYELLRLHKKVIERYDTRIRQLEREIEEMEEDD